MPAHTNTKSTSRSSKSVRAPRIGEEGSRSSSKRSIRSGNCLSAGDDCIWQSADVSTLAAAADDPRVHHVYTTASPLNSARTPSLLADFSPLPSAHPSVSAPPDGRNGTFLPFGWSGHPPTVIISLQPPAHGNRLPQAGNAPPARSPL